MSALCVYSDLLCTELNSGVRILIAGTVPVILMVSGHLVTLPFRNLGALVTT